jgi:hypothetical protein
MRRRTREPIPTAPNGKLEIFDNDATWNATSKLTLAGEGDYVLERQFASSKPSHTEGGALYAQYQLAPKVAFAVRSEYLSDDGRLFSGKTQPLKEATARFNTRFPRIL